MRFVLVIAILVLNLFWGCTQTNNSAINNGLNCSQYLSEKQFAYYDYVKGGYSCMGLQAAPSWSIVDITSNTYSCFSRIGNKVGENAKYHYFDGLFNIERHQKNISADGIILGSDDEVIAIDQLVVKSDDDVFLNIVEIQCHRVK